MLPRGKIPAVWLKEGRDNRKSEKKNCSISMLHGVREEIQDSRVLWESYSQELMNYYFSFLTDIFYIS